MPGVQHASLAMWVLAVALLGPVFLFIWLARSGRRLYIRRIPGIDAIEEAVGRATEMGRPVAFTTGLSGVGPLLFAVLGVFGRVVQLAARYSTGLFVAQNNPEVMAIVEQVMRDAYQAEGHPERFDLSMIRYLSGDQFAYASGYMGTVHREKAASCLLFGHFAAESLILAEAGQQVGAMQVAGTIDCTQVPFFLTSCDYTIIGEEVYAAGAYLSRDPVQLGSLRGQDVGKLIIYAIVFTGVAIATWYGIWGTAHGGYDLWLSRILLPPPN